MPVSPLPQPSSPSSLQQQSPLPYSDDGSDATAALACAFELLQDADKACDSAALADVLQCLGVKCDDVRNLEHFFRYSSTYNP